MSYGKHLLVEVITDSPKHLADKQYITKLLRATARASKMKIVAPLQVYKFPKKPSSALPGGVTALCIVAESHISIHTWPENNYFAFDLFSCRDFSETAVLRLLKKSFSIKKIHTQIVKRGISVNFQ